MKKENKYRFSLQFPADTEEKICVGELLEKLGNKKSAVVVAALNDYMKAHPELKTSTLKISINREVSVQREVLENMVKAIVEEQLSRISIVSGESDESAPEALEDEISQMVSNLQLFT